MTGTDFILRIESLNMKFSNIYRRSWRFFRLLFSLWMVFTVSIVMKLGFS